MRLTLFLVLISVCLLRCKASKKPKVFYLNSYHPGYASSDSVESGINEVLSSCVELERFYLNAKKLPGKLSDSIALLAVKEIRIFDPELIIVSDDDAIKKVIVPYLSNSALPVVFCGVNWNADSYNLSQEHITGMLEILPLAQTISLIQKYYPKAGKIRILSENSVSEQNNKTLLDTLYKRLGLIPEYVFVNNINEWKNAFVRANLESDIIYLPTNGAISGWNEKECKKFVEENIIKPVFTCDDFMMPYAVVGYTKVAKEQGIWAGQTSLRILKGEEPAAIPITRNTQQTGWINLSLAKKLVLIQPLL